LGALARLDYPPSRLDILLLVEEDDRATREAIERCARGAQIRVVVVPDGQPRTKPRALNYGLALSHGDYIVVYDAEDQPEPDQLLKALTVFSRQDARLGCLQARLNIYNPEASRLTRLFTLEYSALFDGVLPVLQRQDLPIMLGGTSNHFPRAALEAVGGWDPFNVTEDADLGLRLARRGYRVGVLASTTWEEAPAGFRVWCGQRTRWLKGWMQTYLVHMRRPRRLMAELGFPRFLAVNILTGAAVLSALVHPWTYLVLAADIATGRALDGGGSLLGAAIWWMAGLHLILSYGAAIVLGWMAVAARGRASLGWSGLWLPFYWMAVSFAAYRAIFELVQRPYHWEKTTHCGRQPEDKAAP
jgi:cellulose synthase/poly-beta-1,6-N-acetylglucosamine synthase-like glycosyltransferase